MLELGLGYSVLAGLAAVCVFYGSRDNSAARSGSPSAVKLAFSFYSVGMGGWALYVPAELGASFGWFGALGYAAVCTSPLWILMTIGPKLQFEDTSLMAWVETRYGVAARVLVTLCSLFYMSIFLASEFTVIGGLFASADVARLAGIVPVAVLTFVHALFRSSSNLQSHGLQGFLCLALVLVAVPAILAQIDVDEARLAAAAEVTRSSISAVGILAIACSTSELLNFAEWQRVWSCEDPRVLSRALGLAVLLVFMTLAGFGAIGVLVSVANPADAFSAAVASSGRVVEVGVFVMGLVLATSTSDALAFGISDVLRQSHPKLGASTLARGAVLTACVFAPCVWVAAKNLSVLSLFMIANLTTSVIAPPVFCGAVIPGITRTALALGILTASATVLVFFLAIPTLTTDLYNFYGFALYASTVSTGGLATFVASRLVQ